MERVSIVTSGGFTSLVRERFAHLVEGQPVRRAVILGGVLGALVGVRAYLRHEYVASTAFSIEGAGSSLPAWAGLASQFGVDLPFGQSTEGPEFYVELALSRDLLARLAEKEFGVSGAPPSRLIDILGRGGSSSADSMQKAVQELRRRIHVGSDPEAGWIRVNVRMRGDSLAEAVTREFLGLLNTTGISRLQSRASAQRHFVDERWQEAQGELTTAEDSLRRFLERNRSVAQSPRLQMESARYERQIQMRQTVFTALAQMKEQARLEEVKATPVISVLETPDGSAEEVADPLVWAVLSAVGGAMCYLAWFNRRRIVLAVTGWI